MSLVYRYRWQICILQGAIEELRGVSNSRACRVFRARVVRRIREWSVELECLEHNLAERLSELHMINNIHAYNTQYSNDDFMHLLHLEIEKEDAWLAGFGARKRATIEYYSEFSEDTS